MCYRAKLSLYVFELWTSFQSGYLLFMFQPPTKLPSLLATWITPTTLTWWLPLWMYMSWPISCSSSASEWFLCWISPGRRCWPLLTSSFSSLTEEFMVGTSFTSLFENWLHLSFSTSLEKCWQSNFSDLKYNFLCRVLQPLSVVVHLSWVMNSQGWFRVSCFTRICGW